MIELVLREPFEIGDGRQQQLCVVPEVADGLIAGTAEQTADLTGCRIMIDTQLPDFATTVLARLRLTADRAHAALVCDHSIVGILGKAILVLEQGHTGARRRRGMLRGRRRFPYLLSHAGGGRAFKIALLRLSVSLGIRRVSKLSVPIIASLADAAPTCNVVPHTTIHVEGAEWLSLTAFGASLLLSIIHVSIILLSSRLRQRQRPLWA